MAAAAEEEEEDTTKEEAEDASAISTEVVATVSDASVLQMLYQIGGKGDDGLIAAPNFDWTDDNIDDVESYISSGEVGILRNYWTDSATAKAVILYYTVCDASPDFAEVDTVGDTLMDRWVEDQWDSLLESGEEFSEIEMSPCEITAEYSLGLPIEIEESLWEALTTSCQAMYGGDYIQDPTSLASPRDPASATGTCLCVPGWSYTALDLPFEF